MDAVEITYLFSKLFLSGVYFGLSIALLLGRKVAEARLMILLSALYALGSACEAMLARPEFIEMIAPLYKAHLHALLELGFAI